MVIHGRPFFDALRRVTVSRRRRLPWQERWQVLAQITYQCLKVGHLRHQFPQILLPRTFQYLQASNSRYGVRSNDFSRLSRVTSD